GLRKPLLEFRGELVERSVQHQGTARGLRHGEGERGPRRLAVLVVEFGEAGDAGFTLEREPSGPAPAHRLPPPVGEGGEELRGALPQRLQEGGAIASRAGRRGVEQRSRRIRPFSLAAEPAADLGDLRVDLPGAPKSPGREGGELLLPRLDLPGQAGPGLGGLPRLLPRLECGAGLGGQADLLLGLAGRGQPGAELLERFAAGGREDLLDATALLGEGAIQLAEPVLEEEALADGLL